MPYLITVELRFVAEPDASRVENALRDLGVLLGGRDELSELRAVRTGATTLAVSWACADEDATRRAQKEVVEPWIERRLGTTLATAPSYVASELLFERRFQSPSDRSEAIEDADTFVAAVVERRTVWGLYGESWARFRVAGEREALPFWSRQEAAVSCIADAWAEYGPRRIELAEFMGPWLTGMVEDGIVAVLMPTNDQDGAVVDASRLREAIAACLTDD